MIKPETIMREQMLFIGINNSGWKNIWQISREKLFKP